MTKHSKFCVSGGILIWTMTETNIAIFCKESVYLLPLSQKYAWGYIANFVDRENFMPSYNWIFHSY